MRNKLKLWCFSLLKVMVAVGGLGLVFSKIELKPLIAHLSTVNLWLLLLAFIVQNLSLICSSLRSQYYLSCYGLNLNIAQSTYLYYVGVMFNTVLPGGIGGDGYRILAMHNRYQFSKLQALRVLFYERVNGFYILVLLGLCFFPYTQFYTVSSILQNLGLFSLIMITPCYLGAARYVFGDDVSYALRAAVFSLGVQVLQVLCVVAIIYSIDPNVNYIMLKNYILLFIVSSAVAVMPISIGSVGLREVTFFYGLTFIECANSTYGVGIAMLASAISIISGVPGLIVWLLKNDNLRKH